MTRVFLWIREDVVEGPEEQPHAAVNVQHLAKADPQGGDVAGRGAGPFAGNDGAGAAISCAPVSTVWLCKSAVRRR
jgi:hypothetical protein